MMEVLQTSRLNPISGYLVASLAVVFRTIAGYLRMSFVTRPRH
jgi:hypothetical protein